MDLHNPGPKAIKSTAIILLHLGAFVACSWVNFTYARCFGFIKKQRLSWLRHIIHMTEENIEQKIKRWKPMSKRQIGSPKTRWEDDILGDIRRMNVNNWKKVAQDRGRWKEVVEQVRILLRLYQFNRNCCGSQASKHITPLKF
jgi:hypothetical protein